MRQLFSTDPAVLLLEGGMDGASHPVLLHHPWVLQSPAPEQDLSTWVLPVATICSYPGYPGGPADPGGISHMRVPQLAHPHPLWL